MELYCGVDLHSNNGLYALVDQDGKRRSHRRLPNDLDTVLEYLGEQAAPIVAITVESTFKWYWLVDGLRDTGYDPVLANPNAIDQYDGLKSPGDKHDAYFLAELLRLGILPTGWICPREERPLRDLLRRRMLLVRYRTGLQLSLQNLLMRQTGRRWSWRQAAKLDRETQQELLADDLLHGVAQRQRGVIERLDNAVGDLEHWAEERFEPRADYELLRTVPGIGTILSMTIMAETGTIDRFPKHGNYTSYSRLTKAKATSNNKTKKSTNRKNGNRYLAWAYAEVATHTRRTCPEAQRWYQRKLGRCGENKPLANKCLAAKYCKACYYILKNHEPFDLGRIFG